MKVVYLSGFPESLNILLIFPPEPINVGFLRFCVFSFIQISIFSQTSLKDFCLFSKRTVPILNDFEFIIFPFEKMVISVLPPPTSTYK